jgi:hypothetical protein
MRNAPKQLLKSTRIGHASFLTPEYPLDKKAHKHPQASSQKKYRLKKFNTFALPAEILLSKSPVSSLHPLIQIIRRFMQ